VGTGNVADIARKWQRNLAGATESIRSGVNAVTVSPTEKAAQQADAYLVGVQQAVADGKFQSGLRRVSLDDWKRSFLEKGVPRIASGAAAAQPDFEQFLSEFLPHVERGKQMLESMPRGDLRQNIARAVAMIEHNSKFRRRG